MTSHTLSDRLPFTLPEFARYSWVSEEARRTWEPRLARIRAAWSQVEWLSVEAGIRSCALVGMTRSEVAATIPLWRSHRISAQSLPISRPETHPGTIFVLVGALDVVRQASEAWSGRDDAALGVFFGYPACCSRFFREVWVEQQSVDTTWAMAAGTAPPVDRRVVLPATGSPLANILWRWLGVRAVPHLPCRFDCAESIRFGERILQVADQAAYAEEASWIREILTWPVEWSALHGIAEIKSPILKLATRTDATATKYTVQWIGTRYPAEGAVGRRFPYRARKPRPKAAAQPVALDDPRQTTGSAAEQSWYYRDNGFTSLDAMHDLHQPLVTLAKATLQCSTGKVLDLGCGNGALLAKICEGSTGLIPHGVDRNPVALEHVGAVLPTFSGNFRVGDIFHIDDWDGGTTYALTLLMAGRLLEVERAVANRLTHWLLAQSGAVLVYMYPERSHRSLSSVAQEFGLLLEEGAGPTAGLLSRTPLPGEVP
jgi:hypothetical protein